MCKYLFLTYLMQQKVIANRTCSSLVTLAIIACSLEQSSARFNYVAESKSHPNGFDQQPTVDHVGQDTGSIRHLRFTGLNDWPNLRIATLDRSRGATRYSGVLVNLMKVLSLKLNFTYSWVPAGNESRFGGRDEATGDPYGLFLLLRDDKTDVLVAGALLNPGRSSIADHTYPHHVASVFLVTRKPLEIPPWRKFVNLFDAATWICLIATSLLAALIANFRASAYSLAGSAVMLMARILSEQSIEMRRVERGSDSAAVPRNVLAWITTFIAVLCVVITSLGKATILSALLTARFQRPIATPDDLRREGLALHLRNGTAYMDIARVLKLKYTASLEDSRCEKITSEPMKYASLFEKGELMAQVVERNCNPRSLWANSDPVATTPIALYVRRGAFSVPDFDAVIQRTVETGLLQKWESDLLSKHEKAEDATDKLLFGSATGSRTTQAKPVTLRFKHVQGPAVFLCGSSALALTVFIGELLVHARKKRGSRRWTRFSRKITAAAEYVVLKSFADSYRKARTAKSYY